MFFRVHVQSSVAYEHVLFKRGDALGEFIRRSPRSGHKISGIRHIRYWRINSPALAQ